MIGTKLCLAVMLAGMWSEPLSAMTFVHPGAIDSKRELDFVREQIRTGAEPWSRELERLRHSGAATREGHGSVKLDSEGEGGRASQEDATAAYTQALIWYYTGEAEYADRAVSVLNSWSELEGFSAGTGQDQLHAGWTGAVFAHAAEILRLYPGWDVGEIGTLQEMFRRAYYPQLSTASPWNGNVDLSQIDAMLSIAVFNEDSDLFEKGIVRLRARSPAYFYLESDGYPPAGISGDGGDLDRFWFEPRRWVDGLTQETCRDNGHHSQFGLGSALHAAEIAWHQGVDVYTENQERFTAAMELMAGQFLSGSMGGLNSDDRPAGGRFNTWEIGYHHYHTREGLRLPNTEKLILEQIRPEAVRAVCNLNYESLTHGGQPAEVSRKRRGKESE